MANLFEDCFRNSLTGVESGRIVYIAGAISGDLLGNLPAFFEAECALRAAGHTTFNPARADGGRSEREAIERALERAGSKTWADYMRQGITGLMRCNSIATLPDWWNSRGAYIEHDLASKMGYAKICYESGRCLYEPQPRSDTIPA